MTPARTEDAFEVPLSTSSTKATNGLNGKRSVAELTEETPAAAAAPAPAKKGKYNAIPGPLGLASASLEGKVALVTGAGESPLPSLFLFFFLPFFWGGGPSFG